MVPQATPISARNMVITQDIIGTPLMFRSNMSLPPWYNALNTSIANPTHNPSCLSNIFIPSRYNVASIFIPTHTQILSGEPHIPPLPLPRGCNDPQSNRVTKIVWFSKLLSVLLQLGFPL
jgi:hypothetical protein